METFLCGAVVAAFIVGFVIGARLAPKPQPRERDPIEGGYD